MARWFRIYPELLHDPKVQRLPGETFKGWVNLLCLAAELDGVLPPLSDIGFALRIAERQAQKLLTDLCAAGLLDETVAGLAPHNWTGRQFTSEESPARKGWRLVRQRLAPLVFARDGFICRYCGAENDLTVDHVRPLARGGSNDIENLVTACRPCNSTKGVRLLGGDD